MNIVAIFADVLTFLTLLNPFALYIYLIPVQKELTWRDFVVTLVKASGIAGGIFMVSAFFGQAFFENVLDLNFEAFRVFGGLVLIMFSTSFIVQGRQSFITLKGSLDDLAGEIALPFMVGAGTISLSILIGSNTRAVQTFVTISLVMICNFLVVLLMAYLRKHAHKVRFRKRLLYNNEMLLRINGFLLGAIGVDMVFRGLRVLL